jgi:hypothetical protein
MMSYIILGEDIMEKIIKEKLEEIVALMNDPEEVVIAKEVKEKLEVILSLLNHPEEIEMGEKDTKKKLEEVVALVNNVMVDPEIDIEYCIPDVATTSESCDVSGDPYILATYIVSDYTRPTRKIRLSGSNMQNSPRVIADLVTFSIEQFKSEIDSVEMG